MTDFTSNPVLSGFDKNYTNPRGIPRAKFVENVEEYIQNEGANTEAVMKKLQEQYSKYKLMELKLIQNKASYKRKQPEIKKALQMVEYLQSKQDSDAPIKTQFELSDNVYANAVLKNPTTVCLWLGANVMVEYSFEEAIALLNKNMDNITTNLRNTDEDLAFLKDQITTMEVNIARIYNYDVKTRRKATGGQ